MEEKLNNKTCGECRYLDKNRYCEFLDFEPKPQMKGCANFEPKPTNGDVIRQGGDRDFAEYFVFETGAMFASTLIVDKTFDTFEEAVEATEDYLNAPADATDIDVLTKESEGEYERP